MSSLSELLDTDPVAGLRETAKLMRGRATAATPCEWIAADSDTVGIVNQHLEDVVEVVGAETDARTWANTEHIVSWQPAVALAAAKLLERWAWLGGHDPDLLHRVGGDEVIALARAYAGGTR